MKDILPPNFSDDSNVNNQSDPSLKINAENLFNYYVTYY